MRKILLLSCSLVLSVVASWAQVTSITIEEFYSDNGTVTGYPAGYTTYRIYANCTNQNDVVASVYGNDESPLSLAVSGGVWNHPGGGVVGPNLNCGLYGFVPALQYDSYVTFSRTCNTDPGNTVYSVEDPAQQWQDEVFNTAPLGASLMSLSTLIGGAWFGLPGDANCFAGPDLKVLIAQITTDGEICGNFNLQVFPDWQMLGDDDLLQTGLSFGTGACGAPGCTDPDALNYDVTAGFDNGLCLYPCAIVFSEVTAIDPSCGSDSDGSIYFEGTGGQDFIQYTFDGVDGGLAPDLYENLGNGTYTLTIHDTRFDNLLFNPGGQYGTCTISQDVALLTEPLVFGPVTSTPVSCGGLSDGCVNSSVTGGVGALSFKVWTCGDTEIEADLPDAAYCGVPGGSYKFSVEDGDGCTAVSSCATVLSPNPLSLFLGLSGDASCFNSPDGVQIVSWGGGTGDVDFSLEDDGVYDLEGNLSNIVLNTLLPGSYTIYAADANGCTDDASFVVDGPDPITISALLTSPSCAGGSDGELVASASGGAAPLLYSLDDENFSSSLSVDGLEGGTYTVYVTDDNGCSTSQDFTLTEPDAISATAGVAHISCFGSADGEIVISADGGTGAYSYSLDGVDYQNSDTFSDLDAGVYDIYVTDANDCMFMATGVVEVDEPSLLEASTSVTNVSCNGEGDGSVVVNATGGTPDYQYSNGGPLVSNNEFSNLDADTYTFTVVDANGCEASAEAEVTEPTVVVITNLSADPIDETPGGNTSYQVAGGSGAYQYEWTDGNGNVVSENANLDDLTDPADAGSYTLVVTDENGCTAEQTIIITGVGEINLGFGVAVLPNPTQGQFRLNLTGLSGERLQYRILDTQGRIVMQNDLGNAGGSRSEVIDISYVAAGVYQINITMGKATQVIKLIKQ